MRVLHLSNHCRIGNGNVHAAVDLACEQVALGNEVFFASAGGEFVELLEREGVRHITFDQSLRASRNIVGKLFEFRRILTEISPDVVHAHMMSGALLAGLGRIFHRVRLVTTVHNAFDRHAVLMFSGDRVVAVSENSRDRLSRRTIFNRSALRTVLNGTVGAVRRDWFPAETFALERPSVLTLCGLHDRKGVQDLVRGFDEVAKSCPDVHLYIAGDGPHRPKYEALARLLPAADRIHFLGSVRDTRALLSQGDVFVLASHAEGLPLVILEAREAGCAVIATQVDGIPEAVDGGAAGLLVPAGAPGALAAALGEVLASPAALDAARRRARLDLRRWSVRRVAEDYQAIYLDASRRNRRAPPRRHGVTKTSAERSVGR